jgi:hypothetical protein
VNHSLEKTPACIEPDREPALRAVLRNLARALSLVLHRAGLPGLGRRVASHPEVRAFPPGQAALFWFLTSALVGSSLSLTASLLFPVLRAPVFLVPALSSLAVVVGLLSVLPSRYAQGDNPGTPYYIGDLVRQAGFRFFWFIKPQPGYQTHVPDTLALPEEACGGRPSCLRVVGLDDGTRVLTFGRVQRKEPGEWLGLEMLSEEGLERLLQGQGTGILYIHWTAMPPFCFTARGLDGLGRLRRHYDEKRIWVARTSEILRFTFARAFLEWELRDEGGRQVIDILRLNDPVGGPFLPDLAELAGIGFECERGREIEVRLADKRLPDGAVEFVDAAEKRVVAFPLPQARRGS